MHNVRFIAINDNIDSITEHSKNDSIIQPFKNIMNDAYSNDISIKVRSQFEVKRKNGDCVAAFAPFGYCKDPKNKHRLMIDLYGASVVRKIFQWKLSGFSQKHIIEKLNDMEILAPSDYKTSISPNYSCSLQKNDKSSWTVAAVNTILKNEVYLGHLIQGKSSSPNVKIKKINKIPAENWIRVENTHKPIISEQDFSLVQKLLHMDTRAAPGENKIYPLSAYVYCKDCKEPMQRKLVTKKSSKYPYYVCGTYKKDKVACQSHLINANKLADSVFVFLKCNIEAGANMEAILKEVINSSISDEETTVHKERLLKSIKRSQELESLCSHLKEDFLEELITKEECKELEELYLKQIEGLQKTINSITQEANLQQKPVFEASFTEITRALVIQMIERVEVYTKNHIKVNFRFDNSFLGLDL